MTTATGNMRLLYEDDNTLFLDIVWQTHNPLYRQIYEYIQGLSKWQYKRILLALQECYTTIDKINLLQDYIGGY